MFPPARRRRKVSKDLTPKPNRLQRKKSGSKNKKKGSQPTTTKKTGTAAAPASAVAAKPVKKKIIGVRRLLARDGDEKDLAIGDSPHAYEHGIENPIISSLITSNPQLLGRVLFTRNPAAATQSDYILSLLTSQGHGNIRRDNSRRRSAAAAALSASSDQLDGGHTARAGSKRKADKILGSLGVDYADAGLRNDVTALVTEHGENGGLLGDTEEDDLAIITREEEKYLLDVLEERATAPHTGTASGAAADAEDLTWLTAEMEREYKLFLAFTNEEASSDSGGDDDNEVNDNAKSFGKYRYKATMTLARGAGQCALGTFRTAEEAAVAYDRHALGRRTLSKKIMEEFQLRRSVKARKAAHVEMRRALEIDRVTPEVAAKRAHAAATHVFESVATDTYLSSEKVTAPELNADGALEFFRIDEYDQEELLAIDDELIVQARANLLEVNKVSAAMLDGGIPDAALETCLAFTEENGTDLELIDAVDGTLSTQINGLITEYKGLTESIASRGSEILRLIKLEESMMPLLREERYCSSKLSASLAAGMVKEEDESM